MKQFKADLSAPVQENFMGLNAIYHDFCAMPDAYGRQYPDELADLEADRAKQLGLKYARTFCHFHAWDKETRTWNWESERCKSFYAWLKRLKDRDIDVGINAGWAIPSDVFDPSHPFVEPSPFAVEGDAFASIKNYANWVSEMVHQLIEVRGFTNVVALHLFTEPRNAVPVPPFKSSLEMWGECAKGVHEALVRDNRRNLVKLVGPNEGGGYNMMVEVAESYGRYIDVYSAHQYQNADLLHLRGTGKFAHSGEVAVPMNIPGANYHQFVNLKANTEYKVSVYLRLICEDPRTITGNVQYGVWEPGENRNYGMNAGGHTYTGRKERYSVKSIDGNELDYEWKKYEFTFFNTKAGEAVFAVFNDIKRHQESTTIMDDAWLSEVGSDENLLLSADLTDTKGWGHVGAFPATLDSADYLKIFGNIAISHIKDNKPFWHDEFNIAKICGNVDPYSSKHGTDLARVFCAIASNGTQNALMWTLFDQIWPNQQNSNDDYFVNGDHRCGVMPVLIDSLVPKPSYYAIGLLGNFFGAKKGCKAYYIPFEDFVETTVNVMEDGNISLLVINSKFEEDEFVFDFGEKIGKTFHRYTYNPENIHPTEEAEMIKSDKDFKVENTITDKLAPYSFSVYTTMDKPF